MALFIPRVVLGHQHSKMFLLVSNFDRNHRKGLEAGLWAGFPTVNSLLEERG